MYNADGKTKREKITDITWADANNLVKTHVTTEVHLKYFSTYQNEVTSTSGANFRLDDEHRVREFRNAQKLNMNITAYIKYLIDKDDEQNN